MSLAQLADDDHRVSAGLVKGVVVGVALRQDIFRKAVQQGGAGGGNRLDRGRKRWWVPPSS